MTQDVLYTRFWSQKTRVPPPEVGWLDIDTAREQYMIGDLDVVDAAERDENGIPKPRWVLGIGQSGVRVRFFDEQMNVWHMVDWDRVDGRLWRWITYDWVYSDTTRQWSRKDAVLDAEAMIRPDGTGDIAIEDQRTGQAYEAEISGKALPEYWLDYPDFGNWATLSEPGPSAHQVAGVEDPTRVR